MLDVRGGSQAVIRESGSHPALFRQMRLWLSGTAVAPICRTSAVGCNTAVSDLNTSSKSRCAVSLARSASTSVNGGSLLMLSQMHDDHRDAA